MYPVHISLCSHIEFQFQTRVQSYSLIKPTLPCHNSFAQNEQLCENLSNSLQSNINVFIFDEKNINKEPN